MLHQVIVSVDKNEKGKIITSNIAADVMGNKNKALKNLISGINNAKSILYIRNEIKDGPSGYSRPPSGARGSTLNTQLHPSGNLIIEDSRRVGKDVAGGGRAREMHSPFGGWRHHLPAPLGSVSHDSQVALLPYESCSLATAERWDNKALQSNPFISRSQHNGAL